MSTVLAEDTLEWSVWSTTARVVVLDPATRQAAFEIIAAYLAEVDEVASRFRADAEIMSLDATSDRPVAVSPLLAEYLAAALDAAERTDGDVDPTLHDALRDIGYDRDFAQLPPATGRPAAAPRITVRRIATWRDIRLDGTLLTLPRGLRLDLGATAKALAADRAAALVHERLGTGVMVSLGGDIATAGTAPEGGWRIRVCDGDGEPEVVVAIPAGAALATSSTIRRRWHHHGAAQHHILDPRTLRPAAPVWRTVTVAATSCLEANTLSTAAIVRGHAGHGWLAGCDAPARLVAADGSVSVVGGWPEEGS